MVESIRLFQLDDDPMLAKELEIGIKASILPCQFQLNSFTKSDEFLKAFAATKPDIAILDIHLKAEDQKTGVDIAKEVRRKWPATLIVMISNDLTRIRDSLLAGADDFIVKGSDVNETVLRLFNLLRQKEKSKARFDAVPTKKVVGDTMRRVAKQVPRIIDSAVRSVYILGESGTGKEMVAQLFESALGSKTPFIKVNCGAIAPTLLERELFGHAKGAYTGAASDKIGFIEAAEGGWLFLDEVASLTMQAQAALLRALENQEVVRLGEIHPRKVNFRLLSATNISLEDLVEKGEFRNDLWQRLCEEVIELPPLRERLKELPEFLQHFCDIEQGGPYKLSREAESVLLQLSWFKGNIREVRNCLRAMTVKHVDKTLTPLAIPSWVWDQLGDDQKSPKPITISATGTLHVPYDSQTPPGLDKLSHLLLIEIIKMFRAGNSSLSLGDAAQQLLIPKSTLVSKLKKCVELGVVDEGKLKELFAKYVG